MQARPGGSWVFDADGHIVEPAGMWDERVPREFRRWIPRVHQEDGYFRFAVGDRLSFCIPGRAETMGIPGQTLDPDPDAQPSQGGFDPAARLVDMDTDAIGIAAVYPTYGLMIQGVTEREPALVLCQAVNDWVADYVSHDRSRLVGVGVLPMTDAGDALGEARRCVEQLGFRGVWRRPEQFPGIPALHDESYEALWEYLAGAGVSFAFHPGMNGIIPYDYLKDRYGDYYTALHAVHFASEQMMALTTMIAYGILERHPALKVAFLECGATWAVPYLYRLHEHVATFGFERGRLSLDPREYFARQCFVSVEEEEPGLAAMMASFPDSVTFASDYPHGDATFPGSTKDLLHSDLGDDVLVRILRTNALRLYGMGGD